MDVRRHLGPLFGPGAGLALGHEVAQQAEPPGSEDDDDGRDEEHRPPDGAQGGSDPVPRDQDEEPGCGEECPAEDAPEQTPA